MQYHCKIAPFLALATLVAGCATTPMGPTVGVLPGQDKSFDVFAKDQAFCKNFASQQVAGQADVANQQAVAGGVLSTLLGTALGGAIGNHTGAGIGAAGGATAGAAGGVASSQTAQGGIQLQYDNAFTQCMYAKGHQIPGVGPIAAQPSSMPGPGDPAPAGAPPQSTWVPPPPPPK
jgi:hypothetical protein